MALANYTDLTTAVEAYLHRGGMTAVIPDFVTVAEARLNRDIRCSLMEAEQSYSSSSRTLALPTGFLQAKSLYRYDSGYPVKLVQLESERFNSIAHDVATGTPEYFNVSSSIKLDVAPASATTFSLRYYKKLDLATDATNWLMTKYPDAYLYASLLAAAPYAKNQADLAMWKDMLGGVLKEINDSENSENIPLMCEIASIGAFDIEVGS